MLDLCRVCDAGAGLSGIIHDMSEIIFLVEDAVEGGYTARALGESIFTEADDMDELRSNIRDAVDCHFGPDSKM